MATSTAITCPDQPHRPAPNDLYATPRDVLWLLLDVPADGSPIRAVGLVTDIERRIPARVVAEQWRLVVSGRRLAALADAPGRDAPPAAAEQPAHRPTPPAAQVDAQPVPFAS